MRVVGSVAWREYASFFRTSLGWVVMALFLALSAAVFSASIQPGEPATLRGFFSVWWALLLFVAPAVSMRLFSDDLRSGTIETLLASPASEASIVGGKFVAAVGFFLTMLAPTLVFVVVLESLSDPDWGPILAGYLGITLMGMLYLAIGLAASTMTSSQTLAYLGTLVVLILADILLVQASSRVGPRVGQVLLGMSPNVRAADFARGLIETRHIVFFLSASFVALAIATVSIQSRRWR